MAMTNYQTNKLRYDELLQMRVAAEIAKAAKFIVAGGGSPTATQLAHAKKAVVDPVAEVSAFIWYVVLDPTVQDNGSDPAATTDAQLASIISTHWPTVWAS